MVPRRQPEIAPVGDSETRRTDQPVDGAIAEQKQVLDNVIGRRHLSVAVVPGKLNELQKVERDRCVPFSKQGNHARFALCPSLRSTYRHLLILSGPIRLGRLANPRCPL